MIEPHITHEPIIEVGIVSGTEIHFNLSAHYRLTGTYVGGCVVYSCYVQGPQTVRYADGRAERAAVSMNKVYRCGAARLYQMSYDADGRGSYLQVGVDRWGRPLTYAGYALLLVGLVWMLLAPRGKFRTLLRHPLLRRGLLGLALLLTGTATTLAAPTLPAGEAERFGRLLVVYGDRVCPVQTLARDFTAKLHGSPRYAGYSAEQVLLGWLFWDSEWSREPIVRVKSAELRRALQLPAYAAFSDFFSPTAGYRLAPYVEAYWQGRRDALTKAAADLDDRLQLLVGLRQGLTPSRCPPRRTRCTAPSSAAS